MPPPAGRFDYPDFTASTILVIDDHQDSMDLLTELLRFCGAHVLTAWSTAQAREHLQVHTPRLIICDFQMPRETGVDFMRWLRGQHDDCATIPAIAVTAYPGDFLKERDRAHAFDAYFVKPIDAQRFLGIVEVLLLRPQPARASRDLKKA